GGRAGRQVQLPRGRRSGLAPSRVEVQRATVDAVAHPALLGGAVVEDVPEVGVAVLADDLGATHPVGVGGAQFDVLEVGGLGEAGPAGPRVELGAGAEQLGPTADAFVHP